MIRSKAQIIATIGPSSDKPEILKALIEHQMDVVRFNFSWGNTDERVRQIDLIRKLEAECKRKISIIVDLPGPRVQKTDGHTYNNEIISSITPADEEFIKFAALHNVDYVAVSFVGGPADIVRCKELIRLNNGKQKVIAKIERKRALEYLDAIIAETDAVMVARGDLGNEVPIEQIPFVQDMIVKKARKAHKMVIVATQMLLSMVEHPEPTRAEVTDVANAILQGADAVMLSEESARGKYPIEAVTVMEKIVLEAEKHLSIEH